MVEASFGWLVTVTVISAVAFVIGIIVILNAFGVYNLDRSSTSASPTDTIGASNPAQNVPGVSSDLHIDTVSRSQPFLSATVDLKQTYSVPPSVEVTSCIDENGLVGESNIPCAVTNITESNFTVAFGQGLQTRDFKTSIAADNAIGSGSGVGASMDIQFIPKINKMAMMYSDNKGSVIALSDPPFDQFTEVKTLSSGDPSGPQKVSIAQVAGRIAIAYMSAGNLSYIRAENQEGTSWGIALNHFLGGLENNVYMVFNAEVPIIAYFNNHTPSTEIVVAIGTDDVGTSFTYGIPVTTASAAAIIQGMAVVEGNPAIAYESAGVMYFVRATEANGSAWGTPVTVDGGAGGVTIRNGLQVVDGTPLVTFVDVSKDHFEVRLANDKLGTSWPSHQGAVAAVGTPDGVGLAIWNNFPVFTWSSSVGFHWVVAKNARGTQWHDVVQREVKSGFTAGSSNSIATSGDSLIIGSQLVAASNEMRNVRYVISGAYELEVDWKEVGFR